MTRRARQAAVTTIATVALVASFVLIAPMPADSATSRTLLTKMHIVGGPVAALGSVVIITADSHHDLHLIGVAPDSGRVIWSRPYEESLIIAGLAPAVYVVNNVVLDISPSAKPDNPSVLIEGINATTGVVVWKSQAGLILADQPLPCADKQDFCAIEYNEDGSTAMAVINPSTGHLNQALSGPARALDDDLYQSDASTPTLEEFSPFGAFIWTTKISDLFGAATYNPDYGWDFLPFGGNEVGSVSSTVQGHNYGLDAAKTVGIDTLNGSEAFALAGEFQCGGSIEDQSPAFLCRYAGNMPTPKKTKKAKKAAVTLTRSYAGMSMQLQGFNPQTGAITWTEPVKDVAALSNGQTEALDDTHLVVQATGGRRVLLDTSTGQTSSISKGESFWCSNFELFKVDEDKKANASEVRVAGATYSPCTASGQPSSKLPGTNPANIGVTVDGVFLWPTPQGLARRVVAQASGFA
ncbi:MAG TPA: hypothetical protein VGG38_20340 [Acidimicrobiales bacterium]|jgi:hypothetical protein